MTADKRSGFGGAMGALAGLIGGMKLGAVAGTLVAPGPGTLVGIVAGGIAGMKRGAKSGERNPGGALVRAAVATVIPMPDFVTAAVTGTLQDQAVDAASQLYRPDLSLDQ